MKYLFLLSIFIFLGCSDSTVQEELSKAKEDLQAAQTQIEELKSQIEPEGELVHFVFLKLKPDVDPNTVITEIKKLNAIDVVKDLQVGPFEPLGDDRALDEYTLVMEMSFDDADHYQVYTVHPIHLDLRVKIGPMLDGRPATYDYMKK